MGTVGIIIKKELRRVFKDKKMVFGLFVFPALLIIGVYALIGQLTTSLMEDVDTHIPKVMIANASTEIKELIDSSVYVKNAEITYATLEEAEEAKKLVTDEKIELIVTFTSNFFETYDNYEKNGDIIPKVVLYYTTAGNYSNQARYIFEDNVLKPLENQMLEKRLGSLEVLRVFELETMLLDEENTAASEILGMMLPYFITMMLFAGAMSLGVDAIAGEKERGTMAMLLLTPVKRSKIALGKVASLTILSSLSACVYTFAMLVSLPSMMESMAAEGMVTTYHITIIQAVSLLLIMLSMVVLYVALVGIVSVYATSAKEAQTYVSPLYIVVILAGLLTMFQGGKEVPLQAFAIPLYGNALVIQKIAMNELIASQFFLSFISTSLLAFLLIAGITKAFNSEKIMFHA